MKKPKPVTIDFETFGIEDRPRYPPVPVGVSIKYFGTKARYFAWGHTSENNSTWADARSALFSAWQHEDGILCQNGKFDTDVAETHFGLKPLAWDKVHDTMFLLFLDDPHQTDLGLKPSAARLLGIPPDEQDAVVGWLVANQPVPGVKISKSKSSDFYAMKFLPYAPAGLVGKYANGDVERTEKIFHLLWKKTLDRGMMESYDRERRLMPILLQMERDGIHVDLPRLRQDVADYTAWMHQVDDWLIRTLKADEAINLDSGEQLMAAMVAAGKVDPDLMPRTPTGKFQTNKDALLLGVKDKVLLGMLKTRASLKTCVNTFMGSWLAMAEATGGTIHTNWNQIKSTDTGNAGTRTGRLSATWFMNIPKEFTPVWAHEEEDPKKRKLLPKCPFSNMPALPKVRSYIVPPPGHVIIDRDYSQQEPRILAHFDGGSLMDKYVAEPWIDFHDYAKAELEKVGRFYDRKPVKNTNLGLIYGMGVGKLAAKNDMSVEEASDLKKAILVLYPGLKDMYTDMRVRAKNNQPVRTWGGREYYCEPPRLVEGRIHEFDYKLVNVLIQGSAADCTKEAIIRFDKARKPEWKLILNVHDQLTAVVPKKDADAAMEVLRQCMQSVEFDVPMLSEGAISQTDWDNLKDYDKKGVRV